MVMDRERSRIAAEDSGGDVNFHLLAELIPQLVWITDGTGQATYFNRRWYELTGASPADSLGSGWISSLHPDDVERTIAVWRQSTATGEIYEIEYRLYDTATDSYRWFLGRALPVRDQQGPIRGWFGTCTDINYQKCLEFERDQLLERERAARIAAQEAVRVRDRFFSVAAHELKTPLTTLFGQAQLLQRRMFSGVVDPERDIRAINRVVEQGRRMHQLIDALLDVPRLETGRITIARLPIDLRQLVQQLVEDIEPTLERHRLTTVYPAEPLLVSGDPMRLSQVFQNLLQNAVKYSPSGGTISVSGIVQDGSARIAIADQGIGIPADVLPNLFQQFYRAANAEQHLIGGLGLGLYVVRELLLLHGGTITVESVEGKGSIFTVELPLAR
jgi:hypothetical protein